MNGKNIVAVFIGMFFMFTVNAKILAVLSPLPSLPETKNLIEKKLEKNIKVVKINETNNDHSFDDYCGAISYAAVDTDMNKMILQKNIHKRLPVASLTKIMTAVVTLDLADPNEFFTVSKKASKVIPTRIGLTEGQSMSVRDLLKGLLLTSGNDTAQVLMEGIDNKYNGPVFIESMNKKAKLLGLVDTHFDNPQGYDSINNYSSSYDLAVLSQYAVDNYPLILEIVKKEYEFLPENKMHKQFDLYNWNGLIGVYPNIYGLKIGNTGNAGHTMIAMSERNGKKITVVLLGAPGVIERDIWAAEILDRGFSITLDLSKVSVTQQMLLDKYSKWKYWN